MQNVLVTGGAGFIGSNFIHHLLRAEQGIRIVNLDALTYAGSLENLKDLPKSDRYTFVQGDICDSSVVDGLLQKHGIDTIVHFAAETHVDRSILGPMQFVQTNVLGTFNLLEAARKAWLTDAGSGNRPLRFHHISTDEVYGSLGKGDPAFSETTPYSPRSPYSASKAASDHLVRAYSHTYRLPVTITNCSNNYGPYQFPEKLVPLTIINALQNKPLPVYGDGLQVRDWLYVEDHCDAIHLVLKHGAAGETYNIGGNNQPANLEIVRQICALLDELRPGSGPYTALITHVTDRPGHDRRYAMDTAKIRDELGWQPRYNLNTGLRSTVEWYLDHPGWIAAVTGQPGYTQWLEKNYNERGGKA
jgi:dTDP-glucose 4,6-dehydratase